jgi:hypothetical protein
MKSQSQTKIESAPVPAAPAATAKALAKLALTKRACELASDSTTRATRDCLIAGQLLVELREDIVQERSEGRFGGAVCIPSEKGNKSLNSLRNSPLYHDVTTVGNGSWESFLESNFTVSRMSAWRWMRAAENVLEVLPEVPELGWDGMSAGEILATGGNGLKSDAAREWQQAWLELTAKITLKGALVGIGGALTGGTGGDRKDYPLFIARKFKHVGTFLGHWDTMTEHQRATVVTVLRDSILGEEAKVGKERFRFAGWPEDVCRVVAEAAKERLKR